MLLTSRMRRARITLLGVLPVLVASGCAERRLVAAPEHSPGTGTWIAVWCAGVLAATVIGALLTLPVWQERGGARFAAGLFALQAGAVAVTAAVLLGVAVRSWQLIDRPVDAAPAETLLRLSRADGDSAFFALMVLLVVVLGSALVSILALGARFARRGDALERLVACVVLGVELGVAAYLVVRLVLGDRGWPFTAGVLAVVPIVVALATCWPARTPAAAPVAPPTWSGLRDSPG